MRIPLTLLAVCAALTHVTAQDLKIGIIGTDTSHVTAFTKLLNDTSAPDHVPGGRVVAAFKSGSADIESSASRVEEYATALERDFGLQFEPEEIEQMLSLELTAMLVEEKLEGSV